MSNRVVGIVKFYKTEKGFGFLERLDGGDDVFVHASVLKGLAMKRGAAPIMPGDRLEFDVVDDERGPKANNVKVLQTA